MPYIGTIDDTQFRDAIVKRALALYNEGSLPGADVLLDTLGASGETMSPVQHLRGLIAVARGDSQTARHRLAHAISLDPADATAHGNLGAVLLSAGDNAAAAAAFETALLLEPTQRAALLNVPNAYIWLGMCDIAIEAYREALAQMPGEVSLQTGLAALLGEVGDIDAANALFADIVSANPDRADLHVAWAMMLLAAGDWSSAWPHYEWRRHDPHDDARSFHQLATARWQGEDLTDKTILLQADGGLEDAIQCIRYAADIKLRGAHVLVQAPAVLMSVLRTAPGVDDVVDPDAWTERCDYFVPLMSLPHIFGVTPDNAAHHEPYLSADSALTAVWRERLNLRSGLAVGIAWQDSSQHDNNRRRSLPLIALHPILDCADIQYVRLALSEEPDETGDLGDHVIDPRAAHAIDTFSDISAIIENLDLVIATDGAIAQLAGALGKEVWILLSARPSWRWLRDRMDTVWYPQARLFRQRGADDWHSLALEVRAALAQKRGDRTPRSAVATRSRPRAELASLCDALFIRGTRLHRSRQVAHSAIAFEQVIALDGKHIQSLCNLAALESERGEFDRAMTLAQRALACGPDQPAAHLAVGNAMLARGHVHEAIAQFRMSLQLHPNNAGLHGSLALALQSDAQFSAALFHFERTVQIDQRQPAQFYLALGTTLAAQERRPGAEISLRHALALDPTNVEIQQALHMVLDQPEATFSSARSS